jgi:branched-chain amino acid transport system permease protein
VGGRSIATLFTARPGAPIVLVAILAVLIVLPGLLGLFPGQGPFDLFLLAGMGIFVIAAVGQYLLTGVAGQPSFGNGAYFAVGAFSMAVLVARDHLTLWLALPIAVAVAGASGLATGLPALRVQGAYLAVASIALVFITQDLLAQYETQSLQATTLTLSRPAALAGDTAFYYFTLGAAIVVLVLVGNLLRGRTGRAMMALRDTAVAASTLGVPLGRTRTLAYLLGAAITGVAGALQALRLGSVSSSSFGLDLSILLVSAVVIGGMGSMRGAVLGGCLVAGIDDLLRYKLPANLGPIEVATASPIISSLLIILVLIRFPEGLDGALLRFRGRLGWT